MLLGVGCQYSTIMDREQVSDEKASYTPGPGLPSGEVEQLFIRPDSTPVCSASGLNVWRAPRTIFIIIIVERCVTTW